MVQRWHTVALSLFYACIHVSVEEQFIILIPIGWAAPAGRLALLRGVRAAGWMGKIPPSAWDWDCAALGRWRGVMEVSVVGMGSVSLRDKTWRHISGQIYQPQSTMESLDKYLALVSVWLFFTAASLARIGSGSLAGMGEFWRDIFQISLVFMISSIPAD